MDWEKREKDVDEAENYLKQWQLAHLTHVKHFVRALDERKFVFTWKGKKLKKCSKTEKAKR